MKQTENQYFGLDRDLPLILPKGSQYIAVDAKKLYIYGDDQRAIKVATTIPPIDTGDPGDKEITTLQTTSDTTQVGAAIKLGLEGVYLVKGTVLGVSNDGTLAYSNIINMTVRVYLNLVEIVGVADSIENSDFPVDAVSSIGGVSNDVFISVNGSAGIVINWKTTIEVLDYSL